MIEFGQTRRGWLGVYIQEVTTDIAESLGLDDDIGALISSVNESGPAAKGGIQPGDVIVKFDGKQIEKMRDLPRIVAETEIGANVQVELFRQGKRQTVEVVLGALEEAELAGVIENGRGKTDDFSFGSLGFTVANLNADLAEELGLDSDAVGVVVREVVPGSPAADKGLTPGDILRRYGQRPIDDAGSLAKDIKEAEEAGRSGVLLLIERDGRERFIQIGFAKK